VPTETITPAIISLITALVAGIFKLFDKTPRASIKADLEVLEKMDKDDPNYELVKKRIDASIKKIYSEKGGIRMYSLYDFIFGLVFILLGVVEYFCFINYLIIG
jgi:hypothetical protein